MYIFPDYCVYKELFILTEIIHCMCVPYFIQPFSYGSQFRQIPIFIKSKTAPNAVMSTFSIFLFVMLLFLQNSFFRLVGHKIQEIFTDKTCFLKYCCNIYSYQNYIGVSISISPHLKTKVIKLFFLILLIYQKKQK